MKADLKALYARLDEACAAVEAVRIELGRVNGLAPAAYGTVDRDTAAAKRLLSGAVLKLIAAEDQTP